MLPVERGRREGRGREKAGASFPAPQLPPCLTGTCACMEFEDGNDGSSCGEVCGPHWRPKPQDNHAYICLPTSALPAAPFQCSVRSLRLSLQLTGPAACAHAAPVLNEDDRNVRSRDLTSEMGGKSCRSTLLPSPVQHPMMQCTTCRSAVLDPCLRLQRQLTGMLACTLAFAIVRR